MESAEKPNFRSRVKLDSINDIKREASKIYRECRSGLIKPDDAYKLICLLRIVGKAIEASEQEKK